MATNNLFHYIYMIGQLSLPEQVGIISLFVSVISVGIMFWLWRLQTKEANESKMILDDTNALTQKLETESEFNKNVNDFFQKREQETNKKFRAIYPAVYKNKPLPLIHQGDFYAIHVVGLALGMNNIELKDIESITQNCKETGSDICQICKGNIIYICSPQSNPCLDFRYPYAIKSPKQHIKKIKNKEQICPINKCCKSGQKREFCKLGSDSDLKKWLESIDMPCWFINDTIILEDETISTTKKIQTSPRRGEGCYQDPLKSSAEKHYVDASKTDFIIDVGIVSDIGILSRQTTDSGIDIIISGIHQYGTWIVADFLNSILRNKHAAKDEKKTELMMGERDFVAIIEGYFNTYSLDVIRSETRIMKIWVKKQGEGRKWVRFE